MKKKSVSMERLLARSRTRTSLISRLFNLHTHPNTMRPHWLDLPPLTA